MRNGQLAAWLLDSRDRLARERTRLLEQFQSPVLTLTLNTPGPDKWLAPVPALFRSARSDVARALADAGWALHRETDLDGLAFPACLWAVAAAAAAVKSLALELETRAPGGRLLDLDVTDAAGAPVTRAGLGLPPRPCFICGQPAHACRVSQRHSPAETAAAFLAVARWGGRELEGEDEREVWEEENS